MSSVSIKNNIISQFEIFLDILYLARILDPKVWVVKGVGVGVG